MKIKLLKKSFWQSMLSVIVFGIFIYFAIGSIPGVNQQSRDLGDGVIETAKTYSDGKTEVLTGKHDEYGRWHGPITIERDDGFDLRFTESVTMVNGQRHGQSVTKYPNGSTHTVCYNMGSRVNCSKSAYKMVGDSTAFQILNYKYPWFMVTLNMIGFDSEYVETYLDTVELVLSDYEFDDEDFDDNYNEVIETLEETKYDSIIGTNYVLLLYRALENMKNAEFRLATIDYYRTDGAGTYNILQTKYPGYILSMNEAGVSNQDLEAFCLKFDTIIASYGLLDLEDPFFPDSADTRMYRAMDSISNSEKSASIFDELKSASKYSLNTNFSNYLNKIDPKLKKLIADNNPKEVATLIQISIFEYYITSDIMRSAVWDAYVLKNGVIELPTVTTEFSGNNSTTSATVQGYVIEDGNNTIISKGIAWGTIYNPTLDNNVEIRGNGTLTFSATLEGLTEGETYYARAFATNSAGTAYGNCISFIAESASGIDYNKIKDLDFNIYPNPASSTTTFAFQNKTTERLNLVIVDLNGKVVLQRELGNFQPGKNQVQLNLSILPNGIYNCQLTNNSSVKANQKLLINR